MRREGGFVGVSVVTTGRTLAFFSTKERNILSTLEHSLHGTRTALTLIVFLKSERSSRLSPPSVVVEVDVAVAVDIRWVLIDIRELTRVSVREGRIASLDIINKRVNCLELV